MMPSPAAAVGFPRHRPPARTVPLWCALPMKSNSTITWLTMTPIRLIIPRRSHKTERRSHKREAERSGHDSIEHYARSQQPFYRVCGSHEQCGVRVQDRNHQNRRQICEAALLLGNILPICM